MRVAQGRAAGAKVIPVLIPRPYQREAMRMAMVYAADHPTGRLLLVIPTRGGKTLIGATLVRNMAIRNGLRALWLVHREELLEEAVEHLVDVGLHPASIGVIKAGRWSDPEAKMQVASDATLDRRKKPIAHLVVTDEAHRDTAPRRRRIRRLYPKAFLLGLTATPKPPPQRDLGEDYDALMVVVQPSELIHDGYLAVPTVYAPERTAVPDLRGLRVVGGDYLVDELEPLLLNPALLDEQVKEWARLADGRTSIAFPVTRAHSMALVARFRAAGIDAHHLDGDTPGGDRKRLLENLKAGKIPILSSPGVLSEGTNVPRVKCVLGVRPTHSLALFIQQSMRCATPWNDVVPRLLDVVGNCYSHGFPFADRKWSLVNVESGELVDKPSAVMKRCVECGAITHGSSVACPACAHPFPKHIPLIPEDPLRLEVVAPGKAMLDQERKRLVEYAQERQFKDPEGWATQVLARKHGAAA